MSQPIDTRPQGLTPGICASGSLNRNSDEIPQGHHTAYAMALPCRYCGHGHCLPGFHCQLCIMELRINDLTARVAKLESP